MNSPSTDRGGNWAAPDCPTGARGHADESLERHAMVEVWWRGWTRLKSQSYHATCDG